jgi:hypothetical protein
MATILKSWFVELTEGEVNPRKDTWKGKRRNAPETPPVEVNRDMPKATSGGTHGATSIPAVSKYTYGERITKQRTQELRTRELENGLVGRRSRPFIQK